MLFGYIYQEFALVSLKPKYFKPCLRIYIEKKLAKKEAKLNKKIAKIEKKIAKYS